VTEPTTGDPVKRMIAQIIQHHFVSSAPRPDLPALPEGVTAMEAHVVGEFDTGVVVTMTDRAVRYFLIRVSEFTTRSSG
jgi:hypothetical protein